MRYIAIAIILAINFTVPLYFDIRMFSVFDLSKITVLYVLTFLLLSTQSLDFKVNRFEDKEHIFLSCAILLLISAISTIFAVEPLTAILGTYKRYNGFLSLVIYLFIMYSIVKYIDKRYVILFVNIIIITACISCVYGLLQFAGKDPFPWSSNFGGRMMGTFGHPAFFSAYIIMVLPLVYAKVIKGKYWLIYILAVCLLIVTFYVTKTRASFLGLIGSSIFFVWFVNEWRNKKIYIIFAIIIIVSVSFNVKDKMSPVNRLVADISNKDEKGNPVLGGTSIQRYYNVLTAIEVINDYPVLGIGLDNFEFVYEYYIDKVLKKYGNAGYSFEMQNRVHSDFFDTAVGIGIIGLIAYFYCIFTYVRMIWKKRHNDKVMIGGMAAGVFGYFIQNQFSFGHVPILILFFSMIGLTVICCRK